MKKIRFTFSLWLSKIVALLNLLIRKDKGTTIPGVFALRLYKDFLSGFTGIDYNKTIFVTGTNGKTTSNNMIVHCLKTAGKSVTTNLAGANLLTGIATSMIKNSSIMGKIKTEYVVFEVDERYLEYIIKYLPAKNLCITNIQKDQVQRNGEPDYIYRKIKTVINKDMQIFINNDEPRAKSLEDYSDNVIYYGIAKNKASFIKKNKYDITMPCPKCNSKIDFNYYNIDNIGSFICKCCGFKSEENIGYIVKNIDFKKLTIECMDKKYNIKYTEPFFIYNYALCIAVCKSFDIADLTINESFVSFKNASGRLEKINYNNKEIKYIRIKQENPETLQSAFDYIAKDNEPKIIMIGLEEIVDFNPHYTNTFYSFDCDVSKMLNIEKCICFSEAVAYDTANRLIYSGFDKDTISILPTDSDEIILRELDKSNCKNVYLVTWLHKYEQLSAIAKKNKKKW